MVDGILDLLSAILVLGIVIAIALGFIVPLANDDLMQYNSQYEDKAILSTMDATEFTENSDVYETEDFVKRKNSFAELVLLMAVQDNRMEYPKGINLRNLVTEVNLRDVRYNQSNLNENEFTAPANNDGTLKAIQYYGENARDFVWNTWSDKENIGVIRFTGDYGVLVDEMSKFLIRANKNNYFSPVSDLDGDGKVTLKDAPKNFFITYQFAIPDNGANIKNNGDNTLKRIYDEEPIFMLQVDGVIKGAEIDTYAEYQEYLNNVRNAVSGK